MCRRSTEWVDKTPAQLVAGGVFEDGLDIACGPTVDRIVQQLTAGVGNEPRGLGRLRVVWRLSLRPVTRTPRSL